jgi:phospholipase C
LPVQDPSSHLVGDQPTVDRRRFLGLALGTSAAALFSTMGMAGQASADTVRRAASVKPAGSDLGAVEHVIFLMMENRSFDHYFGTYRGVRGFDDHRSGDLGVFSQRFPLNNTRPPAGRLLPFRLDTVGTDNAECTFDLTHAWVPQHQCRAGGRMDAFVTTHTEPAYEGPVNGVLTMGYYTRQDIPFYYALADAFTIGDAYHCAVLGPTHPNRLMQLSGTIDPAGKAGGPVLITEGSTAALWSVHWETMPEVLEDHGISWKYYRPDGPLYTVESMEKLGITYDTVLPYFSQYRDASSSLYQKAFVSSFPSDFATDVARGDLPSVSWISPPVGYDDHPPAPPSLGMWFTDQVLQALLTNPDVWSRTVVFLMYDENDGFFDHVSPPVAPPGTDGEYVTVRPLPEEAQGIDGPIGLGFRVPLLVISPFSRGGYVCSETFDHTSQLRFLEERFGVTAPNLSDWRRRTVGDLTATLHLEASDTSVPTLPPTSDAAPAGCTSDDLLEISSTMPPYPLPAHQTMPAQEPGTARRLQPRTSAT